MYFKSKLFTYNKNRDILKTDTNNITRTQSTMTTLQTIQ